MHQKVFSLIPSQSTYLGCRFNPCTGGNQSMFLSHIVVFLFLLSSLKSINISSGDDKIKRLKVYLPCYVEF